MSVMRYSRKLLREAFVVRGTKTYPCGKQYSQSGGMMQRRSYVIVADGSIEHVPLTLHRSVNVAVQSIRLVVMVPFLQHSLSPTEIDRAAKLLIVFVTILVGGSSAIVWKNSLHSKERFGWKRPDTPLVKGTTLGGSRSNHSLQLTCCTPTGYTGTLAV